MPSLTGLWSGEPLLQGGSERLVSLDHSPVSEGILYLSRSDVERACAELDSVALVAEALALHAQKETVLPDEAYLAWTNQSGEAARSLNMPGALLATMGAVGTKIINANPANPRHR